MTRIILFSLLFLLSGILKSEAQIQALPTKVNMGKPELLKPTNRTYKREDLEREFKPGSKWGTKKNVKDFWTARSDRNKNMVYADASKSKALPTMLAER